MNEAAGAARTWWAWAGRSLVALVGAVALVAFAPDTLETTAMLLGLHAIADAPVALLVATLGATQQRPWVPMACVGLVDLVLACVVFIAPGAPAVALLWPAAPVLWAILLGILHLVAASPLRGGSAQRLPGGIGAVNVLPAVVLACLPVPGVLPVARVLSSHAALTGLAMLGLAVALRRRHRRLSR